MSTILDIQVSTIENYFGVEVTNVALGDFLYNSDYKLMAERIREMNDPAERAIEKARLPACLISCMISTGNRTALGQHTTLICLDFDAKQNPCIKDWPELIADLKQIKCIVFAGLSISGQGAFAIVKIAFSDKHKGHFEALTKDFADCGLIADKAGSNYKNLRGYSYNDDRTSFYNPAAQVYYKHLNQQKIRRFTHGKGNEWDKASAATSRIVEAKIDTTSNYNDWIKMGIALATQFGENGRGLFHSISQFYPYYTQEQADQKFNSFLKGNYQHVTMGTFYYLLEGGTHDRYGNSAEQQ